MSIREVTQKTMQRRKAGWKWDSRRQLWHTWELETAIAGKRIRRRGFRSRAEAEHFFRSLKDQERNRAAGIIPPLLFPSAAELFEKALGAITEKREHRRAGRVFRQFLGIMPAGIRLDQVKRKHTRDFVDTRLSQGVKAETANRELNCISAALHRAADFYEQLDSWQPPRVYRPSISRTGRQRVIRRDERTQLIGHLLREQTPGERPEHFTARRRAGLIIYFALLTGLRHGEITALRKSDLDTGARRLRAERFKTRKSGIAVTFIEPLTQTHLYLLGQGAEMFPASPYFFSETGRPSEGVYRTLRRECEKLGVPYGRGTENGLVIHDARHTFVSVLQQGGIDSSTTGSFTAHTKETMVQHYSHASPESRARAMNVIEQEISLEPDGMIEPETLFEGIRQGSISLDEFRAALRNIRLT